MTQKNVPWYDDDYADTLSNLERPITKHLFDVTDDDIRLCLETLNMIDVDGLRINHLFLKQNQFITGVFFEVYNENSDSNIDELITTICNQSPRNTKVFFIPSSEKKKPIRSPSEYDAVNFFEPPALATGLLQPKNIAAICNTMIKDWTGSFYCFDQGLNFVLLFVSGHYCMLAGQRDFVESCINQDYKDSWQPVMDESFDHFKLPSLQMAMIEYGLY